MTHSDYKYRSAQRQGTVRGIKAIQNALEPQIPCDDSETWFTVAQVKRLYDDTWRALQSITDSHGITSANCDWAWSNDAKTSTSTILAIYHKWSYSHSSDTTWIQHGINTTINTTVLRFGHVFTSRIQDSDFTRVHPPIVGSTHTPASRMEGNPWSNCSSSAPGSCSCKRGCWPGHGKARSTEWLAQRRRAAGCKIVALPHQTWQNLLRSDKAIPTSSGPVKLLPSYSEMSVPAEESWQVWKLEQLLRCSLESLGIMIVNRGLGAAHELPFWNACRACQNCWWLDVPHQHAQASHINIYVLTSLSQEKPSFCPHV